MVAKCSSVCAAPVGVGRGGGGREEEEEVGGNEEGHRARGRRSTGGVVREDVGRPDLSLNAAESPASAIGE